MTQPGRFLPFIREQVPDTFPLSFLNEPFTDLADWKKQARGKLLELLHYAPAPCAPRPDEFNAAMQAEAWTWLRKWV